MENKRKGPSVSDDQVKNPSCLEEQLGLILKRMDDICQYQNLNE